MEFISPFVYFENRANPFLKKVNNNNGYLSIN